jgi:hypothetical protein
MRDALSADEKASLEKALVMIDLVPPRGGQVVINLDPQKKVTSVEVKTVLR